MAQNVLVIGGTRFFGRLLVGRLLDAGHRVTIATRGQAADPFATRVERLRVDRRDPAAMGATFAGRRFDLVFDQVCYSPVDASIALAALGDRVGRYVMASTIEVYDRQRGTIARPLREDDVGDDALAAAPIDLAYPWHQPGLPDERYGMGKRQAEAVLAGQRTVPVVRVRLGHVLAGPDDFTGRLASYLQQVDDGAPFSYASAAGVSSFLNAPEIAAFLAWAGEQTFEGAINAACDGALSALDLHRRAATALGRATRPQLAPATPAASLLSPFDYPAPYVLDTGRARSLGYRFSHVDTWLDGVIAEHAAARRPGRVAG